MKLEITITDGEQSYVARILGLHPQYRLNREFLQGASRRLRTKKGQPQRTRTSYQLTDGLYEVDEPDGRRYLAIVNGRRTVLCDSDLDTAANRCRESGVGLADVFSEWAESQRRTSESFACVSVALTRERLAVMRANRRIRQKPDTDRRRQRVQTMTARQAFYGSDAADTRAFMRRLEQAGPEGCLAADLFRCQKASTRAKIYGRDYRNLAYDRKASFIHRLCNALTAMRDWRWGWKQDPCQNFARWVLYVELPQGQVSFHAPERGDGPDYPGEWDGQRASETRILAFCDSVLAPGLMHLASPGLCTDPPSLLGDSPGSMLVAVPQEMAHGPSEFDDAEPTACGASHNALLGPIEAAEYLRLSRNRFLSLRLSIDLKPDNGNSSSPQWSLQTLDCIRPLADEMREIDFVAVGASANACARDLAGTRSRDDIEALYRALQSATYKDNLPARLTELLGNLGVNREFRFSNEAKCYRDAMLSELRPICQPRSGGSIQVAGSGGDGIMSPANIGVAP